MRLSAGMKSPSVHDHVGLGGSTGLAGTLGQPKPALSCPASLPLSLGAVVLYTAQIGGAGFPAAPAYPPLRSLLGPPALSLGALAPHMPDFLLSHVLFVPPSLCLSVSLNFSVPFLSTLPGGENRK